MGESQKKILEMLAQGKINVDDAHRLLSAIGAEEGGYGNRSTAGCCREPGEQGVKQPEIPARHGDAA